MGNNKSFQTSYNSIKMYYIWPFDGSLTAHPNSPSSTPCPSTGPSRPSGSSESSVRSSLFKTSPSLQRTIQTFRDLANTSHSLSSTESPNREQKREQGPLSEIRHRTERSRIGSAAGKACLHLSTSTHQLFKRDSPL